MLILITGAVGFIGSYVAKALLASGHRVIGVDNFNTYYDVALKMRRHAELEALSGYIGIRGDISAYQFLSDVVRNIGQTGSAIWRLSLESDIP